ncbi:MAG TPA: hypothetical protein VF503_05965 [Sphingobium sp.]
MLPIRETALPGNLSEGEVIVMEESRRPHDAPPQMPSLRRHPDRLQKGFSESGRRHPELGGKLGQVQRPVQLVGHQLLRQPDLHGGKFTPDRLRHDISCPGRTTSHGTRHAQGEIERKGTLLLHPKTPCPE